MKPRHRAQARLARHVPALPESSERLPVRRLAQREDEGERTRRIPGETVRVQAEIQVKPLRTVRPEPNAPLLIRLVRNPYALDTGRSVRVPNESRDRPSVLDREPFPNPSAEVAELRDAMKVARPMREIVHHPVLRPHPFGRARRSAEPEVPAFDPRADEEWL